MQTIITVIALGITTSPALAGEGREIMVSSLVAVLFLGFGAIIVVCQLIPGLMLFCSMLKGLLGKGEERGERIVALTPQLGPTMADGGRQVLKAVKKTTPVTGETEEMSDHDPRKREVRKS